MWNIQDYLKKFRVLTSSEGEVKDAVVAVVNKKIGVLLERDAISYHGKRIHIAAHPTVRNEIMLRRSEIVAAVRAQVSCVIEDIR